jgi:phospholipase D1/2
MTRRVLEVGRNCGVIAGVERSEAIVDAADYYRAVHRAIAGARRYVLMSGWQFNSDVHLVRGHEAERLEAPAQLLPLLDWACQRTPELEIYMLAWDFSLAFAIEREWFQKQRFSSKTGRIHFSWDSFVPTNASHHQKLVVIDGQVAFSGGMDLCTSRWDRREHAIDDPLRCRPNGRPAKPYHDIQALVRGEVVNDLQMLFLDRWRASTGERLTLEEVADSSPRDERLSGVGLVLRGADVAVSQTHIPPTDDQATAIREIRALYHDAILAAERLVYLENQYFTSRSLTRAFLRRLEDPQRSRIQIVMVMPQGGDTPKEKLALGDAQTFALGTIREAARRHGHDFRLFYSGAEDDEGSITPTFIHSKLLIVDDRLVSIGSANATNRSFGLDSELNLTWEATTDSDPLVKDIAALRASLIAEHCGGGEPSPWLEPQDLVQRLDAKVKAGCRLRVAELQRRDDRDPLLSLGTDPTGPVDGDMLEDRLDEAWESLDSGWFRKGIESLLARFGIADVGSDRDGSDRG